VKQESENLTIDGKARFMFSSNYPRDFTPNITALDDVSAAKPKIDHQIIHEASDILNAEITIQWWR
jgi:hypothetical protein